MAGRVLASLLCLVLLVCAAVPLQQWLFYRRAKRLLADVQTIELHKSTWSDAQRLMTRWGRYGNYNGQCTAESGRYSINLADGLTGGLEWLRERARVGDE